MIRFEVLQSGPAFEGRSFGSVGPYVKVTVRATIAVDPADPRNAVIADIDKAPRNAQGHARGYTMAWIGWQADIPSQPNQLALAAPVLRGVTGAARDEFLFDHMRTPATATLSWPIADPSSLAVTVRPKWDAPREKPAGLAIRATGARAVEITRPATGFDAGALYEVTYVARDPAVLGLGFAATRDVVSFLKREGAAANPLVAGGRRWSQLGAARHRVRRLTATRRCTTR